MKNRFLTLLAIAGVMGSSLSARDATLEDNIASLYISYFKRAPDYSGLTFWQTRGDNYIAQGSGMLPALQELSAGFATHPTFVSMYGSMGNEDFVKAIYKNALGRDGDADGIAWWTSLLDNGKSRSDMVAEFMNASLTGDITSANYPTLSQEELDAALERQTLIVNKVKVAEAFVDTLTSKTNVLNSQNPENDPAYIASIKVLENVGLDEDSVDSAIGKIYALRNDSYAISTIENSWDSITPDYSFKNTPSLPNNEGPETANYIYIFNNIGQTYIDSYFQTNDLADYKFAKPATAVSCTQYGFTAADLQSSDVQDGVAINLYGSMDTVTYELRTCVEADFSASPYAGSENIMLYGNSAFNY